MRKTGCLRNPQAVLTDAEHVILSGPEVLERAIFDVGFFCHHRALRQVIDHRELNHIAEVSGIDVVSHDARKMISSETITLAEKIVSLANVDDEHELIGAIIFDGLQCWTCWIEHQNPDVRSLLLSLTPPTVRAVDGISHRGCAEKDCASRAALFGARFAFYQKEASGENEE